LRNENDNGGPPVAFPARGGALQLGRTALGGYVKIAVGPTQLLVRGYVAFIISTGSW